MCAVGGCERPREANGQGQFYRLCSGHRSRKKVYGDVHADVPFTPGAMERFHTDFTVPIEYVSAHQRVHKWRGKAATHVCVDCSEPAQEWSYVGRSDFEVRGLARMGTTLRPARWSTDPADYVPRCRSFHRIHDAAQRTEMAA